MFCPSLFVHFISPMHFLSVFILRVLITHIDIFKLFLGFCVLFCRSLFVCWSFLFWPLCCMSFNLRILTTLLVSSSAFSYNLHILVQNTPTLYQVVQVCLYQIHLAKVGNEVSYALFFLSRYENIYGDDKKCYKS
jgi:hypothetical protein